MFLVLGAFLVLTASVPGTAEEEQTAKVKFNISVGGLMAIVSQGYDFSFDFDARGETASWTESVSNLGATLGVDVGVGLFPIPQLELYASYSSYGGNALGDYTFTLPHIYYLDQPNTGSMADVENEFKATSINFGLAFHPVIAGKIKPYFGAGVSSVNVKMDLLDTISITDDIDWTYYEDWFTYWEEVDESISITEIGYTQESQTVWGFHAKAGVNIEVAKNIGIFVEGRYLNATVKFDRPKVTIKADIDFYYYEDYYGWIYTYSESWTDEEEFDIDDKMEIKVGGLRGIVGLKFSF